QPEGAPPAPGRPREERGVRAQQPGGGRWQDREGGPRFLALDVVHGLVRIREAADREGLDVEALPPQGVHLAMDEHEGREPQVLPGHVGDARALRRTRLGGRARRATGARHAAGWAATALRSEAASWSSSAEPPCPA